MRTQYFKNTNKRPGTVYCFIGNNPLGQSIGPNCAGMMARGIPGFWHRREMNSTGAGITQITRKEAEKTIGRTAFRHHIKNINNDRA